jgi:hypothetical protein
MTRAVTLAGYGVLATVLAGYQLAGLLWRRTPTLGDLVGWLSSNRLGRWLLRAAWMWLGWHIFVRSDLG